MKRTFPAMLLFPFLLGVPLTGLCAVPEPTVAATTSELSARVPAQDKQRLENGVRQAAGLWTDADGTPDEFRKFCSANFAAGAEKESLLDTFSDKMESLLGYFTAMERDLHRELDLDTGKLRPIDSLFGAYSPSAHLNEDLFRNKIAFISVLNFPFQPLETVLAESGKWTRRQWAEYRESGMFAFRVPAEIAQKTNEIQAKATEYVNGLYIRLDAVVDGNGKKMFRDGLRVISHWGLRDEIKSLYQEPQPLERQKTIQTIMYRIIAQEIPAAVIDNKAKLWDPARNLVDGKVSPREPDTRYAMLKSVWEAARLNDPFYPGYATLPDRIFRLEREMPEKEYVAILESVLKAPVGMKTADLIRKRLGRDLQPFDIWYDGFRPPRGMEAEKLDAIVRAKYPDAEAFRKDIPQILVKLGFERPTAEFVASRIIVEPARGAGHASGQNMKLDKAHLRTGVRKDGMDYDGFNTSMHELGHTVEQTFSMHRADNYLMARVPSNAFTEDFAFIFQARDLEMLGLAKSDPKTQALKDLNDFWATREIAGVGLVDIRAWHWMYAHPNAAPDEIRRAVIASAKDVWNEFYAPVIGVKDSPILAIYSHMISYPMYLANYPMGHVIAFQIEDYFKTHPLGKDMERMCSLGALTPDEWMRQAVGSPITAKPMISAAEKALNGELASR